MDVNPAQGRQSFAELVNPEIFHCTGIHRLVLQCHNGEDLKGCSQLQANETGKGGEAVEEWLSVP